MKTGILGSGNVGRTLAGKLVGNGHDVMLGTRDPAKLADWLAGEGKGGRAGSVAETAAHGEMVFNATAGSASLDALRMAGAEDLAGKILVDVANPPDVTKMLRDEFGWTHVIDLGDITAARGMEMYLPIWIRLMGALGTARFNIRITR